MADLVVIVPSRGRPEVVDAMEAAFVQNCTDWTDLIWAIDQDDPRADDYRDAISGSTRFASVPVVASSTNMVQALNEAARSLIGPEGYPDLFAIGFMGDDHRPRTKGWDASYLNALREMGTGVVYGNDLLQGENLPTQVAMTSDIVRALGYMAPPSLTHLYVDNFWLELGERAGCIRYLPEVVVEHLHPVAGKADWDEGYKRVNAPEMYHRDRDAYAQYRRMTLPLDVLRVQQLRQVAA